MDQGPEAEKYKKATEAWIRNTSGEALNQAMNKEGLLYHGQVFDQLLKLHDPKKTELIRS